jgi:hypothetical protein
VCSSLCRQFRCCLAVSMLSAVHMVWVGAVLSAVQKVSLGSVVVAVQSGDVLVVARSVIAHSRRYGHSSKLPLFHLMSQARLHLDPLLSKVAVDRLHRLEVLGE